MLAMYAKLFSRITESSLMEEPVQTRYVFMMLLALSDPKGYVIGTDVAISRRLNLRVPEFQEALKALMEPDEHSNSKEHDGRRVIQSDGERGYYLVNYMTYRNLVDEDGRRAYMREYMRDRRLKEKGLEDSVNLSKQPLAALTQEEGEVKAEGKGKEIYTVEFDTFWTSYPRKEAKKQAWKAWRQATDRPDLPTILKAIENFKNSEQWRKNIIPHPATWINQSRWDDEMSANADDEVKDSPDLIYQRPEDRNWTIGQEIQKAMAEAKEEGHL